MSELEWYAFGALMVLLIGLGMIYNALERISRHLSNIADRMLDLSNDQRLD